MSIFKKKKSPTEVLQNFKDLFPEVIKESKIKPTKCVGCRSIYQAKHKHLRREFEKGYRMTECPLCHTLNRAEFEEAGE